VISLHNGMESSYKHLTHVSLGFKFNQPVRVLICSFIVQGRHLQRGSRLVDFDIKLGDAVCIPVEPLSDNQVDCIPPKVKPKKNVNGTSTFCHGDAVSLYVSESKSLSRKSFKKIVVYCQYGEWDLLHFCTF